jgi:hypothetical protein
MSPALSGDILTSMEIQLMQSSRLSFLLFAAILVAGCGNPNQTKVVPVQGKIAFADGKPLPVGSRLLFNPADGKMGNAAAVTDETGAFKVTHQSGSSGAAVGKYTVQVAAPEGGNADFYKIVPRTYFDNGGILTAEVTEGMAPLNYTVTTKK